MVKPTKRDLEAGDIVEVRWATGRRRGQVVTIHGIPGSRHYVIEVPLHGADDEVVAISTVSVREDEILEPAS